MQGTPALILLTLSGVVATNSPGGFAEAVRQLLTVAPQLHTLVLEGVGLHKPVEARRQTPAVRCPVYVVSE